MTEGQDSKIQWRDLFLQLTSLSILIRRNKSRQISSINIRDKVKETVQNYFRILRVSLVNAGTILDTAELDKEMQELLQLANKNSLQAFYITKIKNIQKLSNSLEADCELFLSDLQTSVDSYPISVSESKIIKTLESLLSSAAQSYKQVIADLSDNNRLSFRGTASELREVLREVLDHLAPDDIIIMKEKGFKLEKNCSKPTMSQKASFILKHRGLPKTSAKVPINAIGHIESGIETIGSLTRDIYNRGSVSVHTDYGKIKKAVNGLKMYVDGVLTELLEI